MHRRVIYYFLRKSRKYVALRCLLFVFILLFSSEVCAQWKKIANFPYPVHSIYFLENVGKSNIGFCGTGSKFNFGYAHEWYSVWRTQDSGRNWKLVWSDTNLFLDVNVNAFTFKDSLIGWLTMGFGFSFDSGNVFKTTDGGLSWYSLRLPPKVLPEPFNDIYYNPYTHRLFATHDGEYSEPHTIYSDDDGLTWVDMNSNLGLLGISFADSLTGMISGYNDFANSIVYPDLITSDGGITWKPSDTASNSYQPLGIKNSKTFFAIRNFDEYNYSNFPQQPICRSDDGAQTWDSVGVVNSTPKVNRYLTGTIAGDLNNLYVQSSDPDGIFVSHDQAKTWTSICGPVANTPTRFYIKNNYIYAPDLYGGLYVNATGKANDPRLQIRNSNASVKSGNLVPIDIFYPNEKYYESVDSIEFILNISQNNPLLFERDSLGIGWKEKSKEVTDTSIKFILQRTDTSSPALNSFVIRAYFLATVAKEQSASITLDEVNFNQDVTFRDCMVSSLSKTDSFFVDITDQCGDSTLRNFLSGIMPLKIISLHPNPSRDELTIDIGSSQVQAVPLEIYNALGVKVWAADQYVPAGNVSFHIDTKLLPAGVYSLRLGAAAQPFLKVQ